MNNEIIVLEGQQSNEIDKDDGDISILVVDDDSVCLSIVAGNLKRWYHRVVGMRNPVDALSMLRMKNEKFDLLLTDVHMPQMSGFHLHSLASQEFHLPCVLMSAQSDKKIMEKCLENGAKFYITKPITQSEFKKLWQFTIFGKKNNNINNNIPGIITLKETHLQEEKENSEKQAQNKINGDENRGKNVTKKPKLVWTTSLHNQFLEAINKIGLHKAVPKKILEYMNVPGLKRENIASHLQKYRIFLKRLSEAGNSIEHGLATDWNDRPFRSSFALSHLFLSNALPHFAKQQLLGQEQPRAGVESPLNGNTDETYGNRQSQIARENLLAGRDERGKMVNVMGSNQPDYPRFVELLRNRTPDNGSDIDQTMLRSLTQIPNAYPNSFGECDYEQQRVRFETPITGNNGEAFRNGKNPITHENFFAGGEENGNMMNAMGSTEIYPHVLDSGSDIDQIRLRSLNQISKSYPPSNNYAGLLMNGSGDLFSVANGTSNGVLIEGINYQNMNVSDQLGQDRDFDFFAPEASPLLGFGNANPYMNEVINATPQQEQMLGLHGSSDASLWNGYFGFPFDQEIFGNDFSFNSIGALDNTQVDLGDLPQDGGQGFTNMIG